MRDALAVAVDGYAGARGDETPRRFTRGEQLVEILAVVAQWCTPDHRYFRVRTADETYTLRHDVRLRGWELTGFERTDWSPESAIRHRMSGPQLFDDHHPGRCAGSPARTGRLP